MWSPVLWSLRAMAGSVPDHSNRASVTIKWGSQPFCWWRLLPSICIKHNICGAQESQAQGDKVFPYFCLKSFPSFVCPENFYSLFMFKSVCCFCEAQVAQASAVLSADSSQGDPSSILPLLLTLAMWSWPADLTSLSLSFLPVKWGHRCDHVHGIFTWSLAHSK